MTMAGESSRLSLGTDGSSMKAAFGGVSGVMVEVVQSCGGPPGVLLVAIQPGGSAGATTLSKASVNKVCGSAAALKRTQKMKANVRKNLLVRQKGEKQSLILEDSSKAAKRATKNDLLREDVAGCVRSKARLIAVCRGETIR